MSPLVIWDTQQIAITIGDKVQRGIHVQMKTILSYRTVEFTWNNWTVGVSGFPLSTDR